MIEWRAGGRVQPGQSSAVRRGGGFAPWGGLARWAGLALAGLVSMAAQAADPVRVGLSLSLTGGSAAVGKQTLMALQIWRDDVNAQGGLLGRPLEVVVYDDQSNPATVPGIYAKLIDLDHVDLLVGPYGTNITAAAMPAIMQRGKTVVSIFANAANSEFHYPNYFCMNPTGPAPKGAYSTGFITMAKARGLSSIALVGVESEFGFNALAGARENIRAAGLKTVYDKTYPPNTTDFSSTLRAINAVHPDIVYVAAYPPDSLGILRAAAEVGLKTQMFGGAFVGFLTTSLQQQAGPQLNGLVQYTPYLPAPSLLFAGTREFLDRYEARAAGAGIDPLGYVFPPMAYAAGQVTAQAVAGAGSLDPDRIAAYIRSHSFNTIVGEVAFGNDGEWKDSRVLFVQWQGMSGHGLEDLKGAPHQKILWPQNVKTGELQLPYAPAQ
jgi:branched-chain amino acid transport system substrate-binding protein